MEFTSNNLTFVIVTFKSRKVIYDCLNSLPKDFNKLINKKNFNRLNCVILPMEAFLKAFKTNK